MSIKTPRKTLQLCAGLVSQLLDPKPCQDPPAMLKTPHTPRPWPTLGLTGIASLQIRKNSPKNNKNETLYRRVALPDVK